MKEKKMMWIRYAICFGVVAVLCYLFPYTGDDWAWGSQIGIDRLNQWTLCRKSYRFGNDAFELVKGSYHVRWTDRYSSSV